MSDEKTLLIEKSLLETRVVARLNDETVELHIEQNNGRSLVGNIYKARITRVLPGMNAAFVDIGQSKHGFLFGGDVFDANIDFKKLDQSDFSRSSIPQEEQRKPIEELVKNEQDIIVQVSKDPINTKGARVTSNLTVAGKYLVILPQSEHVGISRRIEDETERNRLEEVVTKHKPEKYGFIIRTAAIDASEEEIKGDILYLSKKWEGIQNKITSSPCPTLLYDESELIGKIIRDENLDNVAEIIVDSQTTHELVNSYLALYDNISHIKQTIHSIEKAHLFDHYDIELDIAKSLSNKVWLPSGGHLIIEETEALTSIDVNTGRFVGTRCAKSTILKTNIEAIKETVKQLRLRNIGGIIILDLIDMLDSKDQEHVYEKLTELLKEDRARTNVLKISELGLVQMTRKRTRNSLLRDFMKNCPACNGQGKIKSAETQALEMIRDLKRLLINTDPRQIEIRVSKKLHHYLKSLSSELISELINANFHTINIKVCDTMESVGNLIKYEIDL